MDTTNFTFQNTFEANYLNISFDEDIKLDDIAIKVIKRDCPSFLIPFSIVNINDNLSLKYKLVNTIALEYADSELNKKEFVSLFINLLDPFVKGKDWFLNYRNICIDPRYVFLDKKKNEVLYIYIPEASYTNSDEEIFDFMKSTFVKTTIKDDPNLQVKIFQFFNKANVTLADLYQLLKDEEQVMHSATMPTMTTHTYAAPVTPVVVADSSKPIISTQVSVPVETAKVVPEKKAEKAPKKLFGGTKENSKQEAKTDPFGDFESDMSGDDGAIVDELFGSSQKKNNKKEVKVKAEKEKKSSGFSLFGNKKKEVAPESVDSQPVQQIVNQINMSDIQSMEIPMADDGVTEILEPVSPVQMQKNLQLIDSAVSGAIPVISLDFNKDYIIIGRASKDEIRPDVEFNTEFKKISRKHLRIEKKNGSYYAIDLGTPNRTFIDNNVMVPNNPYELKNGQMITFTDVAPVRYRVNI